MTQQQSKNSTGKSWDVCLRPFVRWQGLPPGTPWYERFWLTIFFLLIFGHMAVVTLAPRPPVLQDFPDWIYQSVLFAKLATHHGVPGYALKPYPVPNSITTMGCGFLSLFLGWAWAARVWLLLVLTALAGGCLALLRALKASTYASLPILACSVCTGLDLWNGSINFQLGLAFLFLFLRHLLQKNRSPIKTAGLLLLCFFTHMLPCAAGLLALLILALQKRRWHILLPALPTLFCAVWYAMVREPVETRAVPAWHLLPAVLAAVLLPFFAYRPFKRRAFAVLFWLPGSSISPPLLLPTAFTLGKVSLLLSWLGPLNVLTADGGPDLPLFSGRLFTRVAMLGACAAVLGAACLLPAWGRIVQRRDDQRFLAITAMALACMSLLMPADALGVTGIDVRLLHLSLVPGLALLSLFPSRRVTALAVLATALAGFNLAQFAAVQFHPRTISVQHGTPVPFGASPVAPAIRLRYYEALRQERYTEWIFPTAMLRRTNH